MTENTFWTRLGPGILFAGAAIGTSHLVQSTRAGALFGLGFVGIIIFANLVKYPAFRIGPMYAAVTGESLIDGYARLGRGVVFCVAVGLILLQAIIIAATAITSAGIMLALSSMFMPLSLDVRWVGILFLVLAVLVVRIGGYGWVVRLSKVFVVSLTVTTLLATVIALPSIEWHWTIEPFHSMDIGVFLFAVAVMGFMPAGIDLALIHSLWTVEKARAGSASVADVAFDFHVGYIGSALFALCFVFMGAGVMFPNGVEPETAAGPFAAQVLGLYTATLGPWSGVVVGVSALAVMFSTLLAVVDGMPRVQAACYRRLTGDSSSSGVLLSMTLILAACAAVVLMFFMSSFAVFIDFVTTTTFLSGPVLAFLNHLVMTREPVPAAYRLHGGALWWSWMGIVLMSAIAVAYGYFKWF